MPRKDELKQTYSTMWMIRSLLHLKKAISYSQITALGGTHTSERANKTKMEGFTY